MELKNKLWIGGGVAVVLLIVASLTVLNKAWWIKRIVAKYDIEASLLSSDTLKRLIETYYQMPGSITLRKRGVTGGVGSEEEVAETEEQSDTQ
jgi:hypothetical protein